MCDGSCPLDGPADLLQAAAGTLTQQDLDLLLDAVRDRLRRAAADGACPDAIATTVLECAQDLARLQRLLQDNPLR